MSSDPFCLIGHVMERTDGFMTYAGDSSTYAVMRCARCGAQKNRRIDPPTQSAEQKRRFIGNYFADTWAQEAAQTMLDDFERFGYSESAERAAAQQGTTP